MTPQPPALARLFVTLLRLGLRRDEIEADLLELFSIRAAERGRAFATWRYCLDALSLWRLRAPHLLTARRRQLRLGPMMADVIYAGRVFRRQPILFSVAILGLAIAMSLATGVVSIVKAVVFPQSGIRSPESIRRVWLDAVSMPTTGDSPFGGNWAHSDFLALEQTATMISLTASAYDHAEFSVTPGGGGATATGLAVSGNYFSVLKIRPALGRLIAPADDETGRRSIVLSDAVWKRMFGADYSILGRTLWLNGDPYTVVGVAARGSSRPDLIEATPAYWITLTSHQARWNGRAASRMEAATATLNRLKRDAATNPALTEKVKTLEADLAVPERSWNPAVDVLGRLKPGFTDAQAKSELNAIAASIVPLGPRYRAHEVSLRTVDERDPRSVGVGAGLMTIVFLVVVLACANITNLLLANAATRRREIGTRLALGASRGRVVQQLLTECALLGLIAGAVGLGLAIAVVPAFAAYVQVPPSMDLSPDVGVYVFVAAIALLSGLLAGLAPVRYGQRGDVLSSLQADQPGAPRPLPRGSLRSWLVGGQSAISVILLVLAALLARSLERSLTVDLGFDPSDLLSVTASSGMGGRGWDQARATAFWNGALEETRLLPGVVNAALAEIPPFSGISVGRSANRRLIWRNETSAEYFDTLGIRVLQGRSYNNAEMRSEAPVAVISERLAREYWPNEDPIGSSLERVWGPDDTARRTAGLLRKPKGTRVIGVVSDATSQLWTMNAPTIYLPLSPQSHPRLVVRTRQDPHVVARSIQQSLLGIEPGADVETSFTRDGLEKDLQGPKILALLGGLISTFALGLATIGLFGVTAFVVGQRRHEVSVRKTLGASDGAIIRMLLRQSLRPVLIGLCVGLFFAVSFGQSVQAIVVYGVSGRDPIAIVGAVALLLGSAFAAVLGPARRAASADPAQVLKIS